MLHLTSPCHPSDRSGGSLTRLRVTFSFLLMALTAGCRLGIYVPTASPVNTAAPTAIEQQTATPTTLPDATTDALVTRNLSEQHTDPPYFIFANYPALTVGSEAVIAAFSQAVEGTLVRDVASFKSDLNAFANDPLAFPHPYTFLSGYAIYTATESLVSLELTISIYTGGAYPNPATKTVNFDQASGKQLALADMFIPGTAYLEELSRLAEAELTARGTLMFAQGLEPVAANFASWVISQDGLTLIFDVYQVSTYAAGIQRVTIPFEVLSGILVEKSGPAGLAAPALPVDHWSMPIQYPGEDVPSA